jgi:hypothetical protein
MGGGSTITLFYCACCAGVVGLFALGGGLMLWDRVEKRRRAKRRAAAEAIATPTTAAGPGVDPPPPSP